MVKDLIGLADQKKKKKKKKDLIGLRFSPTDEELVNHYLKLKNMGNTRRVEEAISEINILSYEPEVLPSLAKIQSDVPESYFFSRIEYANARNNAKKRCTGSGYWKPTGVDRIIKDKDGVKIGRRKTLVYYKGKAANGVRTHWHMHEYQITCLPDDQTTYVLCKVKKKDKGGDIRSGGNSSSVPSPSLVSDSNTIRAMINTAPEFQVDQQPGQENVYGLSADELRVPIIEQEDLIPPDAFDPNTLVSDLQQQTPYNDDSWSGFPDCNGENFEDFEQPRQENVYGLSADELRVPINQQVDLSPPDAFAPNTFFSDYNHPNVQQQTPYNDDFLSELLGYNGRNFEDMFSYQNFRMQEEHNDYMLRNTVTATTITTASEFEQPGQENVYRNDHWPTKPLSVIIVSDSDIDAESISAVVKHMWMIIGFSILLALIGKIISVY